MAAPFAKKIYASKNWKQCRDAYFAYKHGICERCGAPGEEVHHIKHLTPININNPDIVYGWDNLELLCRNCHIEAHDKTKNLHHGSTAKESEIRYSFDENGQPIERGHVSIVWGAPASGKRTYVQQHMQHMDVRVDLDEITRCFTGLVKGQDDEKRITDYLPAMLTIRDAVYKQCASGLDGVRTIWIVAGLPRASDRKRMQQMFPAAEFIQMECTCEQAMKRAEDDESRADKAKARKIIEDYFRKLET